MKRFPNGSEKMEEEEIKELVENLMHPKSVIATSASVTLRTLKDPRIVKYLMMVFERGDARAKEKAFSLLANIETREALMVMIEIVKGVYSVDFSMRENAIDILHSALEELSRFKDTDSDPPSSLVPPENMAKFENDYDDTKFVEALICALEDPDPVMRKVAADALKHTRNPIARQPLCRVLQDETWETRRLAAQALKNIEGDSFHALEEALYDKVRVVRFAAEEALLSRHGMRAIFALAARKSSFSDQALQDAMLATFNDIVEGTRFFSILHRLGMMDDGFFSQAEKQASYTLHKSLFSKPFFAPVATRGGRRAIRNSRRGIDGENDARLLVGLLIRNAGLELECWEALRRLDRLESTENPIAREILASLDGEGEEEKLNAVLRAVSLMIVKQGRYPEAHPIILKARKMLLFPDRLKRMIRDINANPIGEREFALFTKASELILDVDREIFKETRREGRQRALLRYPRRVIARQVMRRERVA